GKAFDLSGPIGPVHPAATVSNIDTAAISLDVNGQTRQSSTIASLIWSIPESIAYLSGLFELQPGDLIFSGTPEGVGAVNVGDELVGKVDGLGQLKVKIV
ncbi:MAG: fumarylacetoacetate hydrolase family protein, partial [Advenella sp.]